MPAIKDAPLTDETQKVWKAPKTVYEWDDGYKIVYLDQPEDLVTLGRKQVHCSDRHVIWACEEKISYFFAIVGPDYLPHGTIHTKQASWINKPHPRDPEAAKRKIGYYSHTSSCAYDAQAQYNDSQESFEQKFYCPLPNGGKKPAGADDDLWNTYVKSFKALADDYDKKVGSIRIQGRRIKFDGKYLIILSASGTHQGAVDRKRLGEWVNSLAK